jgi:hypothetical protein
MRSVIEKTGVGKKGEERQRRGRRREKRRGGNERTLGAILQKVSPESAVAQLVVLSALQLPPPPLSISLSLPRERASAF